MLELRLKRGQARTAHQPGLGGSRVVVRTPVLLWQVLSLKMHRGGQSTEAPRLQLPWVSSGFPYILLMRRFANCL